MDDDKSWDFFNSAGWLFCTGILLAGWWAEIKTRPFFRKQTFIFSWPGSLIFSLLDCLWEKHRFFIINMFVRSRLRFFSLDLFYYAILASFLWTTLMTIFLFLLRLNLPSLCTTTMCLCVTWISISSSRLITNLSISACGMESFIPTNSKCSRWPY